MESRGYQARTSGAALTRGLLRTLVLLGLAAVATLWSGDESSAGNRAFLLVIAALLAAIAVWGLVETRRELKMIRARSGR
jgi:hypothetical protein